MFGVLFLCGPVLDSLGTSIPWPWTKTIKTGWECVEYWGTETKAAVCWGSVWLNKTLIIDHFHPVIGLNSMDLSFSPEGNDDVQSRVSEISCKFCQHVLRPRCWKYPEANDPPAVMIVWCCLAHCEANDTKQTVMDYLMMDLITGAVTVLQLMKETQPLLSSWWPWLHHQKTLYFCYFWSSSYFFFLINLITRINSQPSKVFLFSLPNF